MRVLANPPRDVKSFNTWILLRRVAAGLIAAAPPLLLKLSDMMPTLITGAVQPALTALRAFSTCAAVAPCELAAAEVVGSTMSCVRLARVNDPKAGFSVKAGKSVATAQLAPGKEIGHLHDWRREIVIKKAVRRTLRIAGVPKFSSSNLGLKMKRPRRCRRPGIETSS